MSEGYALTAAKSRDDSLMLPSPEQYAAMLDSAAAGRYAFPAINVTSSQTLNAAMRGFAEAGSDGIVQVTVGGARYLSGGGERRPDRRPRIGGARAGARGALPGRHRAAHRPLPARSTRTRSCGRCLRTRASARRAASGPLFNSHMFDGSTLPLAENLRLSAELLDQCRELGIVLEVECGVVGGEEDGIGGEGTASERLYTTPEDLLQVAGALGTGDRGRYLLAATFGNVHGIYAPGHVKLRPEILRRRPGGARRSRTPARASSTSSTARAGRRRRNSARRSTTAS